MEGGKQDPDEDAEADGSLKACSTLAAPTAISTRSTESHPLIGLHS
jgi:hypothetical protein